MYTTEVLTNMCKINNIVLPTEEIVKLSDTLKDLKGELLLLTIRGSRAYGTAIEGKSDYDFDGVYITDTNEILGYNPSNTHSDYKPQLNDSNNDIVLYEVGRFIDLLQVGNPNILELLNSPLDSVIYKSDKFEKYFSNTKPFITKQLRNSFVGYAKTQIGKATGLNKKMNNPQPEQRKDMLEFCYVINGGKSVPFWSLMFNEYSHYSSKVEMLNDMKNWAVSKISNGTQLYKIFMLDSGYQTRGVLKDLNSTQFIMSSIPKDVEEGSNPMLIYFNLDGFKKHCKDHKEYWEWVNNRNKDRYKTNMEHGKNYDSKNISHCVRLIEMADDLVNKKEIIVKRPNRDYLLAIKRGEFGYDEIMEVINTKVDKVDTLFLESDLPDVVDKEYTKKLLITIRLDNLKEYE